MIVELNLANLIFILIAVIGAFWAMAKVMAVQALRHLDVRFSAQDAAREVHHKAQAARLDAIESVYREDATQWQRVERELLTMKADMPIHYVRREDYIRGQSVIEAKLDGLGTKLENAQLRALNNGGKP